MIEIQRSGHLLRITPANVELLDKHLAYWHREFSGRGGKPKFERRVLYRLDASGSLVTMAGFLSRIVGLFQKNNLDYSIKDLRSKIWPEPDYSQLKILPNLVFRDEQDIVLAKLVSSELGVINCPTGWGKSFIILLLALVYPTLRIALIVPSRQLAVDAFNTFKNYIADVGMLGAGESSQQRVTVVVDRSLSKLDMNNVDIVVFDECHRACSPDTSAILSQGLWECKVLGFSATPEGRSDNADLIVEMIFGPVLHTVSYQQAQSSGAVVPITVDWVEVPSDGSQPVSTRYNSLVSRQRYGYWRNQNRNEIIARAVREEPVKFGFNDDTQILILVEKAEHAYALAKLLPDFTLVHGQIDEVREKRLKKLNLIEDGWEGASDKDLARFKEEFKIGTLKKVVATGTWGVGVDFPSLPILIRADGSSSKIANQQWSGRVSRTAEGKEFGLIIDFIDSYDEWAKERSRARFRIYKDLGWTNKLPEGGGDYRQNNIW